MSDENNPSGAEEQLPPFVIEGARSSRSRCKSCRKKIEKDTLRLGILFEGPYGTGYMWHHLRCAARHQLEAVEEAYRLEAWKEAKDLPEKIPTLESLAKLFEQAKKTKAKEKKTIPYGELAPSARSRCKHCGEILPKGEVRFALGRKLEFGTQVRINPINVHPQCVTAAVQAEDCVTELIDFAEQIRANTKDVPEDVLNAAIAAVED